MKKTIPLVLMLACATACRQVPPQETQPQAMALEEILSQGDAAAKALMQSLGGKLKAALEAGGPEQALTVCQQLARPATDEVSDQFEHLSISRVSLKPRNPGNAPDPIDLEVLREWQQQLAVGGDVPGDQVRVLADRTAVYYRPIMTQELCLNCHGDPATFQPGLKAKLAELYPEDKATGYRAGELRGAFRVEFPPLENP